MRRNARTIGAINRLKMNARVIGTKTSRAKYSSAKTAAVAIIPTARSRICGVGRTAVASGDAMGHFGTTVSQDAV
jgi:hypothetical protein